MCSPTPSISRHIDIQGLSSGSISAAMAVRSASASTPSRASAASISARPAVQLGFFLGLDPPQLGAQHLAEERMEAKPLIAAIERGQQHVGVREVAERRCRAASLEDAVAELAAEAVENRGAPQEVEPAPGDRNQELIADVVDEEPIIAGES